MAVNNSEVESSEIRSSSEKIVEIEPLFKFRKEAANSTLKNTIIESYKLHASSCSLPELADKMKQDLDAKIPKGWIVFGGKHMVGACSYIEDTLVDFEVDGTSFVIFQTFCPE